MSVFDSGDIRPAPTRGAFPWMRPKAAHANESQVFPLRRCVVQCSIRCMVAHARRRSWARLIREVYEASPLVCPRCSGPIRILSLIADAPVIEKILRHLKLWHRPERRPGPAADQQVHYDEEFVDYA